MDACGCRCRALRQGRSVWETRQGYREGLGGKQGAGEGGSSPPRTRGLPTPRLPQAACGPAGCPQPGAGRVGALPAA